MKMTREEFYNDCKQEVKKATVKLPSVIVSVEFSGDLMLEYENCTEEQAIEMAKEDFKSERLSHRDVTIDDVFCIN